MLSVVRRVWSVAVIAEIVVCGAWGGEEVDSNYVVAKPKEYEGALKNPLKGMAGKRSEDVLAGRHPYVTLVRYTIRWNDLEANATDGATKIKAFSDKAWGEFPKHNMKAVPRVILHWPRPDEINSPGYTSTTWQKKAGRFWPADMNAGDYTSDQFKARVVKLVEKLAGCWDEDGRVAFIDMGIIGYWGEHHSPGPTPEIQKVLGGTFTKYFKNKLVRVRHPWEFTDFKFGIAWDSFAHPQQEEHGDGIERLGDRWKVAPIGGEPAYDWGDFAKALGKDPTETMVNPKYRGRLISYIRRLHANDLSWISQYDYNNPQAAEGAAEVEKALGYRFVIDQVYYPARIETGKKFTVRFTVRNMGSAPFYYNWPVEASLLDPNTRAVVRKGDFKDVDIRKWRPGDKWDPKMEEYIVEPEQYTAEGTFVIDANVAKGRYVLALAIPDPAGMEPAVRFAIRNYYNGGRHPIGYIGVGTDVKEAMLDEKCFDDPAKDMKLRY